jgi:hypothetical protein
MPCVITRGVDRTLATYRSTDRLLATSDADRG